MPNGDQYLLLDGGTGYVKKGTGYWYLVEGEEPDGPDGADFAMLTALEQYSDGFVAVSVQGEQVEWFHDVLPCRTWIELLGDTREVLPIRVWTASVEGEMLPVKAEVTWWDGGLVVCEVTYEWGDPKFPE